MSRRHATVDAATLAELMNPFRALMADPNEPRWRTGWELHSDAAMAATLAQTRAQPDPSWWGERPLWFWLFDLGIAPPLDPRERVRLLVEHGELQPWEAGRIRRLAAEAAARIGTGREQVGPEAAAVALGELLEALQPGGKESMAQR